jgi:hypothetical protein
LRNCEPSDEEKPTGKISENCEPTDGVILKISGKISEKRSSEKVNLIIQDPNEGFSESNIQVLIKHNIFQPLLSMMKQQRMLTPGTFIFSMSTADNRVYTTTITTEDRSILISF